MSGTFISSLKREIFDLQIELNDDPRYVKLARLQDLLSLYEHDSVYNALPPIDFHSRKDDCHNTSSNSNISVELVHRGRQLSEMRVKAVALAGRYLQGRSDPTPTKHILSYLEENGVAISGQNPVSNLSAILSKSDGFKAVGRSGWLLEDQRSHSEAVDLSVEGSSSAAHQSTANNITNVPAHEELPSITDDDPEVL